MFSDSLMAMMFMQVLCFVGTLVMFLFIIRSLASQTAAIRDAQRKQQDALADVERQMMDMAFHLRRMSAGVKNTDQTADLGSLLAAVTPESAERIQGELSRQAEGEPEDEDEATLPQDEALTFTAFPGEAHSAQEKLLPDLKLSSEGQAPAANTRNTGRSGELSLRLDG